MKKRYAADQAEAIQKVAAITETKRPEYIKMKRQKDGRYLITWEREREVFKMKFSEYQTLARRTQRTDVKPGEKLAHAVCGVCSEAGEIAGIFQKSMQGHTLNRDELSKEIGDVLWMLAELCDVFGFDLGEVAEENIEKLKKRYPEGFDPEKSIHRKD